MIPPSNAHRRERGPIENTLLFQPQSQQDFVTSHTGSNTAAECTGFGYNDHSQYYHPSRLTPLSIEPHSLSMSPHNNNQNADFGFIGPIPQWSPDQLEDMTYPTTSANYTMDYETPEIFIDTALAPPHPSMSSHSPAHSHYSPPNGSPRSPWTPYDHYQLTNSPHSPNFSPPSPSCSSGYYSSSPNSGAQPLTPISAQPGGGSPVPFGAVTPPNGTDPSHAQDNNALYSQQLNLFAMPSSKQPEQALNAFGNNGDNVGPFIPQQLYRPHTISDRRRYVEEVQLEEPITFNLLKPRQRGIPLRDALNSKFMHLVGRDDLMFVNRGPSVSIRLEWEGYQSWSRQIPTRDFRSPPGPITRSKLAKNVAKSIERFVIEHRDTPTNSRWRVGPGFIDIDDLILVDLRHVSMGSWQANLRLAR